MVFVSEPTYSAPAHCPLAMIVSHNQPVSTTIHQQCTTLPKKKKQCNIMAYNRVEPMTKNILCCLIGMVRGLHSPSTWGGSLHVLLFHCCGMWVLAIFPWTVQSKSNIGGSDLRDTTWQMLDESPYFPWKKVPTHGGWLSVVGSHGSGKLPSFRGTVTVLKNPG